MRAGTAEADITPPVGVDLTGYVARLGHSVGVHDALYARALVLEDGETRAAIVVCDLLALADETVQAAREAIAAAVGTAPEHVMLACTHTHSGPATVFLHQCGEVDPRYVATLPGALRDVAAAAAARLEPACVAAGAGDLPQGAFNRRGSGSTPDTTVGVVRLTRIDGTVMATLMTYGCHPVVMGPDNLLISADYPGVAARTVAEALGGTALFLTGACGDVNPVRRGAFAEVAWLGEAVAVEVTRVAEGLGAGEVGRLTCASEVLALPLTPVAARDAQAATVEGCRQALREAEALGEPVPIRIARAMLNWAEALAARMDRGEVPTTARAEVQAIGLGPVVLVGVPGELFSSLGARIKAAPGRRQAFVAGYTNGDIGYIPDAGAYAAGGYEVSDAFKYYDAPAALAPEAGEIVVEVARRLCVEAS